MLIKVKVFPGSKRGEVVENSKDRFEIKVKEKPLEGRANEEMLKLLSSFLGVPLKKLRIIKGRRERNKILELID